MTQPSTGRSGAWDWRRAASTIVVALLAVALPRPADSQSSAPAEQPQAGPSVGSLEEFDAILEKWNEAAWMARESGGNAVFDIFGRPLLGYAEQYVFTPEAGQELAALRKRAGEQAAAGDRPGLAETLRQAEARLALAGYRVAILYAFVKLSQGLDAHESALDVFMDKSPEAEQQKTRARLDPLLESARRSLAELMLAPTLDEAKRGVASEPNIALPQVYNEERARLAPFAAAWDSAHGIAPMSRTRSTPCDPPHPEPSAADDSRLDQSTVTQPEYPLDARRLEFAGTIEIRAEISETGCAKRVEIARSAGFQSLDAAALAWAEGLRFHPLLVDGKPTTSWHTFAVTFKLSE